MNHTLKPTSSHFVLYNGEIVSRTQLANFVSKFTQRDQQDTDTSRLQVGYHQTKIFLTSKTEEEAFDALLSDAGISTIYCVNEFVLNKFFPFLEIDFELPNEEDTQIKTMVYSDRCMLVHRLCHFFSALFQQVITYVRQCQGSDPPAVVALSKFVYDQGLDNWIVSPNASDKIGVHLVLKDHYVNGRDSPPSCLVFITKLCAHWMRVNVGSVATFFKLINSKSGSALLLENVGNSENLQSAIQSYGQSTESVDHRERLGEWQKIIDLAPANGRNGLPRGMRTPFSDKHKRPSTGITDMYVVHGIYSMNKTYNIPRTRTMEDMISLGRHGFITFSFNEKQTRLEICKEKIVFVNTKTTNKRARAGWTTLETAKSQHDFYNNSIQRPAYVKGKTNSTVIYFFLTQDRSKRNKRQLKVTKEKAITVMDLFPEVKTSTKEPQEQRQISYDAITIVINPNSVAETSRYCPLKSKIHRESSVMMFVPDPRTCQVIKKCSVSLYCNSCQRQGSKRAESIEIGKVYLYVQLWESLIPLLKEKLGQHHVENRTRFMNQMLY